MSKWKLVPVEPDARMATEGDEAYRAAHNGPIYYGALDALIPAYRAMLSASPASPDVMEVLEFYACKCPDGGCEVGDMEAVCCGNKARALIAQLKERRRER